MSTLNIPFLLKKRKSSEIILNIIMAAAVGFSFVRDTLTREISYPL